MPGELAWRLCAPHIGRPGSIPGQGTKSHMSQLRILMPQLNVIGVLNALKALPSVIDFAMGPTVWTVVPAQ